VWGIVLLVALAASPASVTLRDLVSAAIPEAPSWLHRVLLVTGYVAGVTVLNELFTLPLGYYSGFALERRYGLSRQSPGAWAVDRLKGLAVALLLGIAAANILYGLIARFQTAWWLPGGLVFALLIVVLASLAPIVLLPMFYSVRPMSR
jgi:STE24 endopeptidase